MWPRHITSIIFLWSYLQKGVGNVISTYAGKAVYISKRQQPGRQGFLFAVCCLVFVEGAFLSRLEVLPEPSFHLWKMPGFLRVCVMCVNVFKGAYRESLRIYWIFYSYWSWDQFSLGVDVWLRKHRIMLWKTCSITGLCYTLGCESI